MTEVYHLDNVNVDGPFDDDRLTHIAPTMRQLLTQSEQRFADNVQIDKKIHTSYTLKPTLNEIQSLDNELMTNVKKQELARLLLEQHAIKLQLYYKIYCYPANSGKQYTDTISVLDQQLINRHYIIITYVIFSLYSIFLIIDLKVSFTKKLKNKASSMELAALSGLLGLGYLISKASGTKEGFDNALATNKKSYLDIIRTTNQFTDEAENLLKEAIAESKASFIKNIS